MVDVGGGARERFQSLNVEEPDAVLEAGTESYYAHSQSHHTPSPPASTWRHSMQGEGSSVRGSLVECVPPDLLHIKNDPENLGSLCSSSDSGAGVDMTEAAEDARARGRLLQEITRVAETFEPYVASPTPGAVYRHYDLPPESSSEPEYILSDTPQWCWSRSPTEDRSLGGSTTESLLMGSGQHGETGINSLQYSVASQLIPDAFSSPLPPISIAQSPTSVSTCSPSGPPLPSALDLSPSPHQLPLLQPSLLTPGTTHLATGSSLPPSQQLETMQPSLMALDLAPHHSLDDSLMVVAEEVPHPANHQSHQAASTPYTRSHRLKCLMKVPLEEVNHPCDSQEDSIQASADSPLPEPTVQNPDRLFKCNHCDQTFSRVETLKTHELTHSGERPFSCGKCGTTFLTKAMLIRHRKVHTGEKPYRCDVCETCFTESGSLKVHKRLHSGEKPFKCDVCDVAFNGAGMLATHKRKHTGEKPYMCDECGKTFRLLSTLKSHRRRHTGEKPFVCEVCGASFTQRAAMQRHKRIHSDHKPWECDQCGYKFREKENLRKHVALHKIKLQHLCSVCGAGFNQAKKLETHKMLHNGGDRPYQCNKCPSTFTNPKYLTQHKKRVHDKKGAIRCDECNGTFKRKESLRSHMRIHKGIRSFICVECGAAFNQRGSLTKHVRIHGDDASSNVSDRDSLGNKSCSDMSLGKSYNGQVIDASISEDDPYSCAVCSIGFSTQRELVHHRRSNHPAQRSSHATSVGEQDDDDSSEHIRDKYVCEDCDQTFFRKRQLKAHKKYCPCRCPSYQLEPSVEVETIVSSLHSDTKEMDAMKLLTAALGVTGSGRDHELSQHQHHQPHHSPPSPHHYSSPVPLSPHHYPSPSPLSPQQYPSSLSPHLCTSPSPHTITTEKHGHHCQELFSFTTSNISHHQLQHHLVRQDSDHLQLPQQQLLHLPHLPTQLQDHLQHQSSDHLQQLMHQQNALKQLSEDNLLKLAEEHSQQQQSLHPMQHSSFVQQTDHNPSRIQYYSQSLDPPQEPPSQQHHDHTCHLIQHSDLLQPSSRECSDMHQDHLQQNSRHHAHPQQPMKQHRHLPQTPRQPSQQPHEQSSTEDQLAPLPQPPSLDSDQHQQRLSQGHHHHHLQINAAEEQQFYKDASLSLSSNQAHFPHPQSLHLHHDLPQPLSDDAVDDCDDLAPSLHHHGHNNHHQLPQHFYQPEEDNQGEDKQHYHHHHHTLLHHHQHTKLEDSPDIKIKNELGTHSFN